MDDTNAKDPISEAVEKVRKEAYAAGYQAAIAAMNSALSDITNAVPEISTGGSIVSFTSGGKTPPGAPTVGTIPHYVWTAVQKKPGMTNSELIGVVQQHAPKASDGVIRVAINRMRAKKFIVSRHDKWFPA
ncbi:MAG TPA: hypothetical protein VFP60_04230 [Pseudolabrys sp.]|nr:hypothetical protein [Pseudolabrys sp.]